MAAVPPGEPPEAEIEAHHTDERIIYRLRTLPVIMYFFFNPPTVTLTLALATARLTSLVKETLMQNTPESLKNWRRIIWQSGEGVAALQTVSIGVIQSASEITVQTSLGRLKEG